ncbi:MAG: MFS transporter [Sphingobacteriales bacterium]|nr:MFS transporter [Sphingobacteriales bacterium]OJW05140.1 MAG: MFS transporter [Sphingobacteriales bacterium 44-61]
MTTTTDTVNTGAVSRSISSSLTILMAVTCGLVVANIYYNQPLLVEIGHTFNVSDSTVSLLATMTQVGYTIGLLFAVPLGDKVERKRLVLIMLAIAFLSMLVSALAPSFEVLVVAGLFTGIFSAVPQVLLPMTAQLAGDHERGKVVGRVMSGLLIGILLSRTISGYVGAHFGWRIMFGAGAGIMVILSLALLRYLPYSQPTYQGSYASLMRSLVTLARTLRPLQKSALTGCFMFAAFSVFWTTLVFFLEGTPYHYGSDMVGLFGLIGACGALAAPLAGKSADKRGPQFTLRLGIFASMFSYILLGAGGTYLWVLIIGVIILDIGMQTTHISNQSRIFSLIPEARSRINTVYMTSAFIGGSLGSVAGSLAWAHGGWIYVSAVALVFVLIAYLVNTFVPHK